MKNFLFLLSAILFLSCNSKEGKTSSSELCGIDSTHFEVISPIEKETPEELHKNKELAKKDTFNIDSILSLAAKYRIRYLNEPLILEIDGKWVDNDSCLQWVAIDDWLEKAVHNSCLDNKSIALYVAVSKYLDGCYAESFSYAMWSYYKQHLNELTDLSKVLTNIPPEKQENIIENTVSSLWFEFISDRDLSISSDNSAIETYERIQARYPEMINFLESVQWPLRVEDDRLFLGEQELRRMECWNF